MEPPVKKKLNDSNAFIFELKKFIGKEVEVTDVSMNIYEGICKAIAFNHLNVILMTKAEKIVVKNISCIKRKRGRVRGKDERRKA